MKNKNLSMDYPWDDIDVSTIVLPHELLVYYLYKYNLDKKAKKESALREDESSIKKFSTLLNKEREVSRDVFKNSR